MAVRRRGAARCRAAASRQPALLARRHCRVAAGSVPCLPGSWWLAARHGPQASGPAAPAAGGGREGSRGASAGVLRGRRLQLLLGCSSCNCLVVVVVVLLLLLPLGCAGPGCPQKKTTENAMQKQATATQGLSRSPMRANFQNRPLNLRGHGAGSDVCEAHMPRVGGSLAGRRRPSPPALAAPPPAAAAGRAHPVRSFSRLGAATRGAIWGGAGSAGAARGREQAAWRASGRRTFALDVGAGADGQQHHDEEGGEGEEGGHEPRAPGRGWCRRGLCEGTAGVIRDRLHSAARGCRAPASGQWAPGGPCRLTWPVPSQTGQLA